MKLSIVVPVYDERPRLAVTVKQALAVEYGCDLELIVARAAGVPADPALDAIDDPRVRVVDAGADPAHGGTDAATGDYLIVLDADQRYDARDIPRLLEPVRDGRGTVVYGRRTFGSHSGATFWHVIGVKALTTAANMIFNCYLADLETGYKLMPTETYRSIAGRSRGAGRDAALTGRLLRRGIRPFEVGVSFHSPAADRPGAPVRERRRRVRALLVLLRERLRREPA